MTALPRSLPVKLIQRTNIQSAYDRCLREEQCLMELRDQDVNMRLPLISIRILGYLFHWAPKDVAVDTLVKEIHSCKKDEDMYEVGDIYLRAFFRAFKAAKERTPILSNHASRPSFDTLSDMIKDYLEPPPSISCHREKEFRDGFRCVVTHKYDTKSVKKNAELLARYREGCREGMSFHNIAHTECAHIFSESTNTNIEPGSDKLDWVSPMWAVMARFGYPTLRDELNGPNIHRLENVMTLHPGMHKFFDELGIWFVATNTEHTYRIETTADNEFFLQDYPTVTFTTSKPSLPLPSPVYLSIHAACAKVAHLSGASEWFQKCYDDEEEHFHKTLATDGNSASLLHDLLWIHTNQSGTTV